MITEVYLYYKCLCEKLYTSVPMVQCAKKSTYSHALCRLFLQEPVETLQSRQSVSLLVGLSCLYGIHDLSVLPHGLLAAHNHLIQHPHLTAGRHISHAEQMLIDVNRICRSCDVYIFA